MLRVRSCVGGGDNRFVQAQGGCRCWRCVDMRAPWRRLSWSRPSCLAAPFRCCFASPLTAFGSWKVDAASCFWSRRSRCQSFTHRNASLVLWSNVHAAVTAAPA